MSAATTNPLRHPLLEEAGVLHGFGVRDSVAPARTLRPQQVHGTTVVLVELGEEPGLIPVEADAVASRVPELPVAVVTADCVPILACSDDGRAVAAVHAGWRGLAQGVVEAGIAALTELAGSGSPLRAVIGPHIGICCYEVDEPVLSSLGERFGAQLLDASRPSSAGHAHIDLGRLAAVALERAGVAGGARGFIPDSCTRCGGERFHSYRRDGEAAGRLIHFIAAAGGEREG